MMTQTIILDDFGIFLGKKGERFVVKKSGGQVAEFPAKEVERILVSSRGASVSSSALYLAVENRVPVCFTYASGKPFAFLTPTTGHGTVLTRRSQYAHAESDKGWCLAVSFVSGKLLNQAYLLGNWAKNRTRTSPAVSEQLFQKAQMVQRIMADASSLQGPMSYEARLALMNLEGRAAAEYWSAVALILPADFGFKNRTTRGAPDPINKLLNYGYGILYSEVWSAIDTAGLDPFAGFLHVDRPGRPSMVLDLVEEFRQQVVDRVVLTLAVKKILSAENVVENGGLSKNAKRVLADAVVERMNERVNIADKSITIQNAMVRQAWAVSGFLRGENQSYSPFVLKW